MIIYLDLVRDFDKTPKNEKKKHGLNLFPKDLRSTTRIVSWGISEEEQREGVY